jgi:Arc/MetJ family transcription regulator
VAQSEEFRAMRKPGKAEKRAARNDRLSAALRQNLKRRKAQARARAAGTAPDDDAADDVPVREAGAPDFRRNPRRE